MVSDEFQGGKSPVHNQAAYLKAQQIAQQNAAAQQQRQQAPSGLSADSPQYQQVKAAEAKAAQQAYVAGQFSQKGSTSDKYASAREAALQSGRFDYGSYGQQVPQSFVTSKGIRIERPVIPMVQGAQTTPQGTAPVITISARQLQRTNALRAQEGLPPLESVVNVNVLATGTPSTQPIPQAPQIQRSENRIQISLKQLQKTNAARASQGLPPLETVMRVDIVKPTKGTTPAQDYRSQIAQALGQAQGLLGQARGSEVSSFLKFPFAGQKVQSQNIPSTSLADLFAFVPIGAGSISKGAIEAGKEISGLFTKAFSGEATRVGESIIKTGSADIGTNVPKYTEEFRTEKNIQSMIQQKMKTPPKEMAKQTPLPSTTEISLGAGTGREVSSSGGKVSTSDIFKPSPPIRPSPTEKTVSAGRGLEQIVKQEEKQVTKTIQKQKQKPEFEQRQAQKQEKYLRDQEQKAEQIQKQEQIQKEAGTKIEQVQKTEQSLIQKTGLKYIRTTQQKQEQTPFPLIQIPKPKQTQRTTPVFVIPKTEPKPQPFPLIQIPKPKQTQKYVPGGIFIPTFVTPPPPTRTPPPPPPPVIPPPPPIRPPTETPPPTKRPPPEFGLLGTGGAPGMLGKVSKYGQRREFIGNVPIADIVGVYGSRSEISYGGGGARQTSKELSKAATGKFIQSTRKKVF